MLPKGGERPAAWSAPFTALAVDTFFFGVRLLFFEFMLNF